LNHENIYLQLRQRTCLIVNFDYDRNHDIYQQCAQTILISYVFIFLDQDSLDDLKESQDQFDSEDKIDVKFLKKAFSEKQRLEQKKAFEIVQQRLTESLRDLCLPKLLCEIAAKPTYLLSDKEKHVLSLLK